MPTSRWTGIPVLLCLLALFWPVRGSALVGATDGPAGAGLEGSKTVFRTCDRPLPFSLADGYVRGSDERPAATLLMEQQFEANCNKAKAQRWQFCALVLAAVLWRRRRPADGRFLAQRAALLLAAAAVAIAAVSAARALDLIYTSRFHILWVTVGLYVAGNALWNARSRPAEDPALDRPQPHVAR